MIRPMPGAVTLDGPMTPLISARQLAEYMNVSGKTLRRAVLAGEIPHVKIGDSYRFDPRAVRESLNKKPGKP